MTPDYAEEVFDAISEPLLILDSRLRTQRANRAFCRLFGPPRPGRSVFEMDGGRWNLPGLRTHLQSLAREEKPFTDWEADFTLPRLGSRTLSITGRVVPQHDGEGRGLLMVFNDVSTHKHVAEAAALRQSEARQREFVANVSHELMTPITAIKGYSEALLTGAHEPRDKRLRFLQIISRHAERLSQLVEDILQLSAFEAGRPASAETTVLRPAVLKLVREMSRPARKRSIRVRVLVPAGLKVAVGRAVLSQVLQNLYENALKYNRPKGRVFIRAARVGKRVLMSVQDTGIGVPPDDLPRIFDRFHRAENARAHGERGTGLGLAIVKSILVGHGCRIWAESAQGKGTTIFFTLPLA